MKNPSVAVLASGEGTTTETIIRAWAGHSDAPRVRMVISNNKSAGVFKKIADLNHELKLSVESCYISRLTHPAKPDEIVTPGCQTVSEELALLNLLGKGNFDLIVLLGYMKKIGPNLVHKFGWRPEYTKAYQSRMLNTHPGLLPETKGLHGMLVADYVIAERLSYAGQTLHVVANDYDEGPAVVEHKTVVTPDDTPQSLQKRVQAVEKQYIAGDLADFIKNRQEFLSRKEL